MAILNVTPDSFSDGGKLGTLQAVVAAASRAVEDGATILDVGGESTRPGAARVPADEQIRRVVPAIASIRQAVGDGPVISVDTTLAEVARAALDAGAEMINDVAAGTEDPEIFTLCAQRSAGLILMHRLRPPGSDAYSDRYHEPPAYTDVVGEVRDFLGARLHAAVAAGVAREAVVIDPGLGFGKTVEQNLALIRGTARLLELSCPVLSGLSRKSFVARASGMGPETSPQERQSGTVALTIAHVAAGARIARVHDAKPIRDAFEAYSGAAKREPHA